MMNLVKKALKGDSRSLIELTMRIQYQEITFNELKDILENQKRETEYSLYLKAVVYSVGAEADDFIVKKNTDKSEKLISELIDQHHSSWALTLRAFFNDDKEEMKRAAIRKNPMAIGNCIGYGLYGVTDGLKYLKKYFDQFPDVLRTQIESNLIEKSRIGSNSENRWLDFYRYFRATNQYMAAESIMEQAAISGSLSAIQQLLKKIDNRNNAIMYCSGYKVTLDVILKKLHQQLSQNEGYAEAGSERKALPKTDEVLNEMLPELQRIMKIDRSELKHNEKDLQKVKLADEYYAIIKLRSFIREKVKVWAEVKKYLIDNPYHNDVKGIVNEVDLLFDQVKAELNKGLNIFETQGRELGMQLASEEQLNEMKWHLAIKSLERILEAHQHVKQSTAKK